MAEPEAEAEEPSRCLAASLPGAFTGAARFWYGAAEHRSKRRGADGDADGDGGARVRPARGRRVATPSRRWRVPER